MREDDFFDEDLFDDFLDEDERFFAALLVAMSILLEDQMADAVSAVASQCARIFG